MRFRKIPEAVFSYAVKRIRIDISSGRTGFSDAVVYRYIPGTLCRFFASVMFIPDDFRAIVVIYRMVTGNAAGFRQVCGKLVCGSKRLVLEDELIAGFGKLLGIDGFPCAACNLTLQRIGCI